MRTDKQWMCVIIKGKKVDMADYSTLKWTRKESIEAMLYNKSGRTVYSWRQLRSFGWQCVKVSIVINPIL